MTIEIADEIVNRSGLTAQEALLGVAILLYKEEKLTLTQAAQMVGLHLIQFQQALTKRQIPINYTVEDFDKDLLNR